MKVYRFEPDEKRTAGYLEQGKSEAGEGDTGDMTTKLEVAMVNVKGNLWLAVYKSATGGASPTIATLIIDPSNGVASAVIQRTTLSLR